MNAVGALEVDLIVMVPEPTITLGMAVEINENLRVELSLQKLLTAHQAKKRYSGWA